MTDVLAISWSDETLQGLYRCYSNKSVQRYLACEIFTALCNHNADGFFERIKDLKDFGKTLPFSREAVTQLVADGLTNENEQDWMNLAEFCRDIGLQRLSSCFWATGVTFDEINWWNHELMSEFFTEPFPTNMDASTAIRAFIECVGR